MNLSNILTTILFLAALGALIIYASRFAGVLARRAQV